MNLTFLNPLFLFGLAAGILPFLIHRLTQRKPVRRRFSAVRLLLQSQRVVARPERLKHLLLLALRVLAVITLVLLMARPVLWRQGFLTLGEEGGNVIVIDNSLSMDYREERGERLALARKAARELIERLQGDFLLIPTATPSPPAPWWMNREEAREHSAAIPLSFGPGDLARAFALAYQALGQLKKPKEILVVSDFGRGEWEGFDFSRLGPIPSDVGLTFFRIGGEDRDPNLAVKGVQLLEGEGILGAPNRLEVTVANLSDQPLSTIVHLYLSGTKIDQKGWEGKSRDEGKVLFELPLERSGWVNGEIRLSDDRLPADNVFYFSMKVREKVNVLVVDGDPRISPRASESYYLARALRPGEGGDSPFRPRIISAPEFPGYDLNPYEAVFLLNVPEPPLFKLASFLESGRPVFIFLGDRVVPEHYNAFPLLPWRIHRSIKLEGKPPQKMARVKEGHESLGFLPGRKGESLPSVSFRSYYEIGGSARELLTLENGAPLLVEATLGKGRIFLFTSSADLDWNDFPLKAAYLPFIQGLLKEALGLGPNALPPSLRFGQPFSEKTPPNQMAGPPGGPGIYRFELSSGEKRVAVNIPWEESDLSKMTPQEMEVKFRPWNPQWVEYGEGIVEGLPSGRKELWPQLLLFLLAVLALEMGVASRI